MFHPPLQTSHRRVVREQVLLKLCESREAERNVRNGRIVLKNSVDGSAGRILLKSQKLALNNINDLAWQPARENR